MDSDSISAIVSIGILLFCSAFLSATETAFSSLNRIRLKHMAENGSKKASLAMHLHDDYDKLLATILIGNNVVNIALASIATVLFVRYWGNSGVTLSTVVVTVVVVIFGEITPKSLAKESPEKFAMFSASILRLLVFLFTPVTLLFSRWKKLLSKWFNSSEDKSITEEELLTLLEEAEQDGAINEEDKQLIHSVIDFNDSKASDILTPRVDIVGVSSETAVETVTAAFIQSGYSRIPVYDGSIDNIIGVIHIRDFFELTLKQKKAISEIVTPAVFSAPNTKISDLLKLLQLKKCHLAVITDEYGGTAGIVTMEDILEELVGEIWDEHDEIVEAITKLDDGTYKIACSASIDKMLDFFDLPGDEVDASTVSGWVIEQLGAIPKEGDTFTCGNLFVAVTKTDHRRVTEINVNPLPSAE